MDPLDLADNRADGLGARGDFNPRSRLDRLNEGQGMGYRTDTADPLREVERLNQVSAHPHVFDASMGEARLDVNADDPLAFDVEREPNRFFQSGMGRSNRNGIGCQSARPALSQVKVDSFVMHLGSPTSRVA